MNPQKPLTIFLPGGQVFGKQVGGTIIYERNTGEILSVYNAKLVRAEFSYLQDWKFTFNRRYSQSPLDYNFVYHQLTISAQGGD